MVSEDVQALFNKLDADARKGGYFLGMIEIRSLFSQARNVSRLKDDGYGKELSEGVEGEIVE